MVFNFNVIKTKFMIFNHQPHANSQLHLNGQIIERVKEFKYLGSAITDKVDTEKGKNQN